MVIKCYYCDGHMVFAAVVGGSKRYKCGKCGSTKDIPRSADKRRVK